MILNSNANLRVPIRMRSTLGVLIAAFVMRAVSVARGGSPDGCVPPPYVVAVDATSRQAGLEEVPGFKQTSVARPDFTLTNLRCLAHTFSREPIATKGLTVFVFDTRWAAADFDGGDVMTMTPAIARSYRFLRARIVIDPSIGEHSITLTPLGHARGSDFDTRIDVAADTLSSCRFAVHGRCLLALERLDANESLPPRDHLSVTLQASLGRNGDISDVRVRSANGSGSPGARRRLVAAAVAHVKTWSFEPSPRFERLYLTYEFGRRTSAPHAQTDLWLPLADGVAVMASTTRVSQGPDGR